MASRLTIFILIVLDKSSKSVQTGLPFNAQVVDTQTGMVSATTNDKGFETSGTDV